MDPPSPSKGLLKKTVSGVLTNFPCSRTGSTLRAQTMVSPFRMSKAIVCPLRDTPSHWRPCLMSGRTTPLRHPHRSVTEIHPFLPSSPQVGGRYPSPLRSYPQLVAGIHPPFRHTCVPVAGIHPKSNQDGFPIKNVGKDADWIDSRQKHAGMTWQIPYNTGWK